MSHLIQQLCLQHLQSIYCLGNQLINNGILQCQQNVKQKFCVLVINVYVIINSRYCYCHILYSHIDHILERLVEVVRNLLDLHLLGQEILLHLSGCRQANDEDDYGSDTIEHSCKLNIFVQCRRFEISTCFKRNIYIYFFFANLQNLLKCLNNCCLVADFFFICAPLSRLCDC